MGRSHFFLAFIRNFIDILPYYFFEGSQISGFVRVLKNQNQAVEQGPRRCDTRSIFKHM